MRHNYRAKSIWERTPGGMEAAGGFMKGGSIENEWTRLQDV